MKYLVRALKYFVQISLIMALILGALMLSGVISKDINVAFQKGWTSVGYIALMFAGVSAFYPLFGYTRRRIVAPGDPAEYRSLIQEAFRDRGYLPDGEGTFRSASTWMRITRLWEDRITVTPILGGFELEGLTRDLARVASSIEHRISTP